MCPQFGESFKRDSTVHVRLGESSNDIQCTDPTFMYSDSGVSVARIHQRGARLVWNEQSVATMIVFITSEV